jgi:hypothetical protein
MLWLGMSKLVGICCPQLWSIWHMAKRKSGKQDGENHDMLELGQKQRSGRMLSEYIRAIGSEISEVILDDGPSPGPPRLVSKAEAMARHIWKKALPSTDDEGNKLEPDLDYIKIVLDRSDGKPGVTEKEAEDSGKESVPDRISRMNQERLNKLAEKAMGDDT